MLDEQRWCYEAGVRKRVGELAFELGYISDADRLGLIDLQSESQDLPIKDAARAPRAIEFARILPSVLTLLGTLLVFLYLTNKDYDAGSSASIAAWIALILAGLIAVGDGILRILGPGFLSAGLRRLSFRPWIRRTFLTIWIAIILRLIFIVGAGTGNVQELVQWSGLLSLASMTLVYLESQRYRRLNGFRARYIRVRQLIARCDALATTNVASGSDKDKLIETILEALCQQIRTTRGRVVSFGPFMKKIGVSGKMQRRAIRAIHAMYFEPSADGSFFDMRGHICLDAPQEVRAFSDTFKRLLKPVRFNSEWFRKTKQWADGEAARENKSPIEVFRGVPGRCEHVSACGAVFATNRSYEANTASCRTFDSDFMSRISEGRSPTIDAFFGFAQFCAAPVPNYGDTRSPRGVLMVARNYENALSREDKTAVACAARALGGGLNHVAQALISANQVKEADEYRNR